MNKHGIQSRILFALLELVQNTYFVVIPLRTACETNLSRGDEEEELAAAAAAAAAGEPSFADRLTPPDQRAQLKWA